MITQFWFIIFIFLLKTILYSGLDPSSVIDGFIDRSNTNEPVMVQKDNLKLCGMLPIWACGAFSLIGLLFRAFTRREWSFSITSTVFMALFSFLEGVCLMLIVVQITDLEAISPFGVMRICFIPIFQESVTVLLSFLSLGRKPGYIVGIVSIGCCVLSVLPLISTVQYYISNDKQKHSFFVLIFSDITRNLTGSDTIFADWLPYIGFAFCGAIQGPLAKLGILMKSMEQGYLYRVLGSAIRSDKNDQFSWYVTHGRTPELMTGIRFDFDGITTLEKRERKRKYKATKLKQMMDEGLTEEDKNRDKTSAVNEKKSSHDPPIPKVIKNPNASAGFMNQIPVPTKKMMKNLFNSNVAQNVDYINDNAIPDYIKYGVADVKSTYISRDFYNKTKNNSNAVFNGGTANNAEDLDFAESSTKNEKLIEALVNKKDKIVYTEDQLKLLKLLRNYNPIDYMLLGGYPVKKKKVKNLTFGEQISKPVSDSSFFSAPYGILPSYDMAFLTSIFTALGTLVKPLNSLSISSQYNNMIVEIKTFFNVVLMRTVNLNIAIVSKGSAKIRPENTYLFFIILAFAVFYSLKTIVTPFFYNVIKRSTTATAIVGGLLEMSLGLFMAIIMLASKSNVLNYMDNVTDSCILFALIILIIILFLLKEGTNNMEATKKLLHSAIKASNLYGKALPLDVVNKQNRKTGIIEAEPMLIVTGQELEMLKKSTHKKKKESALSELVNEEEIADGMEFTDSKEYKDKKMRETKEKEEIKKREIEEKRRKEEEFKNTVSTSLKNEIKNIKKASSDSKNVYGVSITHEFINKSSTYPLVRKGAEAFFTYRSLKFYEGVIYPYNEVPYIECFTLSWVMLSICKHQYGRLKRHPYYDLIKEKISLGLYSNAAAFEARKTLNQIDQERKAAINALEKPSKTNMEKLDRVKFRSDFEVKYKLLIERLLKINSRIFLDVNRDIINVWNLEKALQKKKIKSAKRKNNMIEIDKKMLKNNMELDVDYANKKYIAFLQSLEKAKLDKLEPIAISRDVREYNDVDIYKTTVYTLDGARIKNVVDPKTDTYLQSLYSQREKHYTRLNPNLYHKEIKVDPNKPIGSEYDNKPHYIPYADKIEDKIQDSQRYMQGLSGLNVISQMPATENFTESAKDMMKNKKVISEEKLLLYNAKLKFVLSLIDMFGEEFPDNVKKLVIVDISAVNKKKQADYYYETYEEQAPMENVENVA